METGTSGSEDILHYASRFPNKRRADNKTVNYVLTIGYQPFYYCVHLQRHDILWWQNVGLGPLLKDCSAIMWGKQWGMVEGAIAVPVQQYHENWYKYMFSFMYVYTYMYSFMNVIYMKIGVTNCLIYVVHPYGWSCLFFLKYYEILYRIFRLFFFYNDFPDVNMPFTKAYFCSFRY